MTPRIEPLSEPYPPEVAERLAALMPGGREPIRLFRTLVRNQPMAAGLNAWGSYYLSRQLSLSLRERELVIDRTTARCGCDYEWGVHIATYGERVGLTAAQVSSLAGGFPTDPCWSIHDAVLLEAVDALHDTATVDDRLWPRLAAEFTEAQLLDLFLLAGWYHAISFAANAARIAPEDWAPRLAQPSSAASPGSSSETNPSVGRTHRDTGGSMPKGYWVSAYRAVSDPEKLAAYNELAGPTVKAGGGRTLVRGGRVAAHDAGLAERTVLVEFDSFEQAVAARESAAYQEALVALADGVERDFRIVEGVD